MLNYVRLPLINNKNLVTEIKYSGFFDMERIFEAIQFKLAKEVIPSKDLERDMRF
jgi:hypothetical protein